MDLYDVLILLFFIAVVLLVEGMYLLWSSYKGPEANRIERRLMIMSAGAHGGAESDLLKKRLLSDTPFLEHVLLSIPRIHSLDRLLMQTGMKMKLMSIIGLSLALALAGFFLAAFFGLHLVISLALMVLLGSLPYFYLHYRKGQRLIKFDEQLPDALDLIGRGIRAGHALPSALKMISDEMADPIGEEFRIAFDEVNYGFSMQDALTNLATRVPSTDLRYFVVAVLIQRETGGNLAELLDNISALIRGRQKLYGTIRVLSAEGKLSAWILTLLPICLALIINLINPTFMAVLWKDPVGIKMVVGMIILMILGIFWMRKIIKIRV
ncbi:MAG: type II secretion system F family protein [Rhodocyclaceae bacterium]|nr:type II secretion system F family protein [Rhodocyclaceae bacterium]